MRVLDNNMKIHVGLAKSLPLSVDTEKDLQEIKKNMEKQCPRKLLHFKERRVPIHT